MEAGLVLSDDLAYWNQERDECLAVDLARETV